MIDFKKIFSGKKTDVNVTDPISDVVTESLSKPQRQDLSSKLDSCILYLVSCILFVAPLLFVPILADWFDLPRKSFLLIGCLLVLGLWLVRCVLENKLPFTRSVFLIPMVFLTIASVISALLTDNKILSVSGDPLLYLGLLLLYIVITQLTTTTKILNLFLKSLLAAGALLSILSIAQVTLSLSPAFQSFTSYNFFFNLAFSPTGSPLSLAIFLIIILPIGAGIYLESRKNKTDFISALLFGVIALGLLATVYGLFRQKPILLPQNVGWKVATSTLGNSLSSAFLGIGPGNFIDAFTQNKPLDFNANNYWNLRFTTSSNFYFYLLTTTGIAGLASFLFLVVRTLGLARKRLEGGTVSSLERGLIGSVLVAIVLFALLPAPAVALIAFFIVLAVLASHFKIGENAVYASVIPDISARQPWFRPVAIVLVLAFLGMTIFHLSKLVLADYNFALSLSAAQNNQGTETYNRQIETVTLNPWNDNYRVSYSQTNLALADALAAQPNLTDQQKQTVVTLVQQAIRESRLAVALAPLRAANWENLSLIYRGLINFAQGADQWAIDSQNQAISLDPANPRLRLDLGSIYFAQKDYQTAAQIFATAINLKPDLANAHYNLAQTLKLLKLNDQAAQQLQLTASLVCANGQTPDCQRVNAEIQNLGAQPAASPAAAVNPEMGSTLATPSSNTNLPKAKTQPPAKVASPGGELVP